MSHHTEETSLLHNNKEIKDVNDHDELFFDACQQESDTEEEKEEIYEESSDNTGSDCSLPLQKICYGLGHVYNDLCAAIWFSYTLFYFQIVLQMDPTTAGTLIMIGQVADSLATPSAGWAVDWTGTPRVWHLTGTAFVAIGFTTMFSYAPSKNSDNSWWVLLYYGGLVIFFQIGWAIVQISHLSIITTIAKDNRQSSILTSIRYTASVCCNVFVYMVTWALLKNGNAMMTQLGPADFNKFKEIILIITCVGLVCSLIFYSGINTTTTTFLPPTRSNIHKRHQHRIVEVDNANGNLDKFDNDMSMTAACDTKGDTIHDDNSEDITAQQIDDSLTDLLPKSSNHRKSFLKCFVTYQVSLMYMSSRLYTILNLIYIPLYLEERLADDNNEEIDSLRGAIASVPLMCFMSSFIVSLVINNRPIVINDKVVFTIGSFVSLIGCAWIAIGIPDGTNLDVYAVAILIGAGGSGTMITSLCLTAQFVNTNGFKSGSVYSTVTFTDKLISGAVVLLIQHMECGVQDMCPNFYQNVLAYASGTSTILGLLALATLQCYNPLMQN